MTVRKRSILIAAAVAVVVLTVIIVLLIRARPRRHRVFRREPVPIPKVAKGLPPVERWTDLFSRLPPHDLAELLESIEQKQPDLYSRWSLGYLHARALLEDNEPKEAAKKLAPFLAKGNPFRELALYHQSEIDESVRQQFIFEYPRSSYRDQAIDEETESIQDAQKLTEFAAKLYPSADTARRRDLDAHVAALTGSFDKALAVLRGGTMDDPSERAARVLDRPAFVQRMNPQQVATLGEAMQNHRHFDRAVALLSSIKAPSADTIFAIGRSYYGDEKFAQAKQTYLRGAQLAKLPAQKATFLWHAARSAQLLGDDVGAEALMTQSIAVPGRSPAQIAALTQRIRLRLKRKRIAEANADLALLRKMAPNDHNIVGAATAFAAMRIFVPVDPKLLNRSDRAELAYWRGRALESRNPHGAFTAFAEALTSDTPFAAMARERILKSTALKQELAALDARLAAAKNPVEAKAIATERYLIAPTPKLAEIYRRIPQYRAVLDAKPSAFPRFPVAANDRPTLLMAMGLFDEAADDIPQSWSLLTRSLALNRGDASRQSIYDIERFMKSVPADYVDALLPNVVRQLLYPRYFAGAIEEDAKKYGADPTLVLAIMREESRFNPRAKSEAAARGLLQFIITTARDIGRETGLVDVEPDDLYDPRIIIRLGAKYIGTLQAQFKNDHYAASAAYNAGPKQVVLWQRMAAGEGDDYLVTAINFDETKDYVRKVMSSYGQYREIYLPPAMTRSYTSR